MNFAFCTCVKFGETCIKEIEDKVNLKLIITLRDKIAKHKVGRVYLKKKKNQKILKIHNINDKIVEKYLKKLKIDWLFIIGWSQIAKKNILKSVKKKVIGAHPTLLPRGKGRAPIPWTILKKLKKSGVSFFIINENIDSGPLIHQEKFKLDYEENANTLFKKVNLYHAKGIHKVIDLIKKDRISYINTKNKIETYWKKRSPQDGLLKKNFKVKTVDLLVKALTEPYPCAFYKINNMEYLKIISGKIGKQVGKKSIKFKDGFYTPTKFKKLKFIN